MITKMYDASGNEMFLKPGHVWMIEKDAFCQVKMYNTDEPLEAEFGSQHIVSLSNKSTE